MKLEGKNVIVTGASRGFGRYLASTLWSEGANLLLVARRAFDFDLDPQRFINQSAEALSIDLSVSPLAGEAIVKRAKRVWTKIDGLVNNAAIQGPVGLSWENGWAEWFLTLTVDLIAPVNLCQLVVPWMLEQGSGKIVNLSGGGATGVRPNYSAYATAKTGLVRFSECLAAELTGKGIDVNCVSPGKMPTDMLPRGETATPDSMQKAAELVVFLLSDKSNGITGKLISAIWDDWSFEKFKAILNEQPDLYTLRRIT